MKAYNIKSRRSGREVANQVVVETTKKTYFFSYDVLVAVIVGKQVLLDETYYDYSRTTSRHLCTFLKESSMKDIKNGIKKGFYSLIDLSTYE